MFGPPRFGGLSGGFAVTINDTLIGITFTPTTINIAEGGASSTYTAVLTTQVEAFSNGINLARYSFYKKVGPRIESILSTDQGEGFGTLFLPYLPQAHKEVKQ